MKKECRDDVRRKYILSTLSSVGYLPRWTVLILDIFVCMVALFVANALSQDLYYYKHTIGKDNIAFTMMLLLSMQVFWFWLFRSYTGVLRHTTYVDLIRIGSSVFCNVMLVLIANLILGYTEVGPIFLKASAVMYGLVASLLLVVFRIVIKTVYQEVVVTSQNKEKVVVYGVKSAGVSIAQMIMSDDDGKYYLSGFISDDNNKFNQKLLGKHIFSMNDREVLLKELRKRDVNAVIISPIMLSRVKIEDLNWFLLNDINVLNLPVMKDWKDGDVIEGIDLKNNLKKMQIEDLLGRTPIVLDDGHIINSIKGKRVMITGAAGSIGSEIARQVMGYNPKLLILIDNAETALNDLKLELGDMHSEVPYVCIIADVRNEERMRQLFEEYKPNYVYHAAAYKHVPMMEDYPAECVLANVRGTMNIANCAVDSGVERFVMVSTDKAVNPTNVMGASKRIAEIYVQSLNKASGKNRCTKFITTRFGNVLGSNGSVIPLFRKQIEAGGPITVTHPDIIRYFMTIPEACQLVLEAGVMGEGGEIYVFDMGKPVKIVDLAKKMVSMAGLKLNTHIKIEYTGLRPGEKLYEELLNTQETTIATTHEKIMVAKVREYDYEEVVEQLGYLNALAVEAKDYLIVEQMKKIVPEYRSKNSRFERLD